MENVVTVDDLRTRLSGFFDELYPDILLPEADLMAARAEVDGAAGMRYALPLKNSALVKNWVLTLAEELAWSRSGRGRAPDNVVERVGVVRRQLAELAAGRLHLTGQDETAATENVAMFEGEIPQFTRAKLTGY